MVAFPYEYINYSCVHRGIYYYKLSWCLLQKIKIFLTSSHLVIVPNKYAISYSIPTHTMGASTCVNRSLECKVFAFLINH